MNSRERNALDRHITGNYGEDQFRGENEEELAPPCECEQPGHFNSGLPGALANVVAGKLNSQVERCDLCQRYPSDAAARKALLEKLTADWKRKAEAL